MNPIETHKNRSKRSHIFHRWIALNGVIEKLSTPFSDRLSRHIGEEGFERRALITVQPLVNSSSAPSPVSRALKRSSLCFVLWDLEAAPIGWQLFILGSCQSDSTAFWLPLDTYATRLLAQALI